MLVLSTHTIVRSPRAPTLDGRDNLDSWVIIRSMVERVKQDLVGTNQAAALFGVAAVELRA